jgi:alpha-beta hydrolase superfamily lysophospholipase
VTSPAATSVADRFRFTDRAEPLCLGATEPRVYGYTWRPPAPRATLVLLHGLQSHAGWFADAAETLLDGGLAVYALDRRGSGSSRGVRGDVGRYVDWLDEVATIVEQARADFPASPVHLVGHCFGANVALGCVLIRGLVVHSIVMLTPGLYVQPDYSAWEKARIVLSGLGAPDTRFRVPQDDDLFTRDPDVLAWIQQDALGARTVTARCLWQVNAMLGALRRDVGQVRVPVLVLEAARDRLSDNTRNRALLTRALGDRCRWQTFDAEHFLLAEPCREQVIDALVRWATEEANPPC